MVENVIVSNEKAYYVVVPKEKYNLTIVYLRKEKAKKYAKNNKDSIIINAGLFNMVKKVPLGQLVIDHKDESVTSYIENDNGVAISAKECYPMLVDDSFNIVSDSYDRASVENKSENLAKKYKYAVCGWGLLYDNFEKTNFIEDEIRWGKDQKRRQIIGQLENGDYFILTCDNAYYKDIYSFLEDKKVKIAYSLDGGRSSKLYINSKQLNKKSLRGFVPTIVEFIAK